MHYDGDGDGDGDEEEEDMMMMFMFMFIRRALVAPYHSLFPPLVVVVLVRIHRHELFFCSSVLLRSRFGTCTCTCTCTATSRSEIECICVCVCVYACRRVDTQR